MKKTISILTACVLIAAAAMPLSAEISFSQKAFTELKSGAKAPPPKKAPPPPKKAPPPKRHRHRDYAAETFGEILADIFLFSWLIDNSLVNYEKYPYEFDNRYLVFSTVDNSETEELIPPDGTRESRFSISSDAFYSKEKGFGINSEFEGIVFKFVGPVFNNKLFMPQTGIRNRVPAYNLSGRFDLGFRFSIIQSNPFSMFFTCQYSNWYGRFVPDYIDERNGMNIAIEFKSYPVKPLVLNLIFKSQMPFSSNINYDEIVFSAGCMIKNIEVYAAYSFTQVINTGNLDTTDDDIVHERYNSISVGAKCYF